MTSIFAQKCAKLGLDPEKTSILKLAAVQRGIVDRDVSAFELACIDAGLDHTKTSFVKLASVHLGVMDGELSTHEIESRLGNGWIHQICQVPDLIL